MALSLLLVAFVVTLLLLVVGWLAMRQKGEQVSRAVVVEKPKAKPQPVVEKKGSSEPKKVVKGSAVSAVVPHPRLVTTLKNHRATVGYVG